MQVDKIVKIKSKESFFDDANDCIAYKDTSYYQVFKKFDSEIILRKLHYKLIRLHLKIDKYISNSIDSIITFLSRFIKY